MILEVSLIIRQILDKIRSYAENGSNYTQWTYFRLDLFIYHTWRPVKIENVNKIKIRQASHNSLNANKFRDFRMM